MFNLFKKQGVTWLSPISGEIIPIEEVPDPVFSDKMMGDGFGVIPGDSFVYSPPLAGKVIKVFKTKHAVLIVSQEGLEVIVHIGLGTVELKGEGFTIHVEEGQDIEAGIKLATVDFDYVRTQGKSIVSPIVITNMEKVKSMDVSYGNHSALEDVCKIITK